MARLIAAAAAAGLLLGAAPALAQVGAPSDEDLQASPPQFRSELSGGRLKPTDEEMNRPVVGGAPPSADPRDFNGIYSALRRPGAAGGPPAPYPAGAARPASGAPPAGARPPAGAGGGRNVGSRACVYRSFPSLGSYTTTIMMNDWTALFLMEENHTMRWARFTDRHDPAFIANYSGDSIARWDGNTLVVDTTGVKVENSAEIKHYSERFTKQPDGNVTFERFEIGADGTSTALDKGGFRWRPDLTYVEDICEDLGDAFGVEYK